MWGPPPQNLWRPPPPIPHAPTPRPPIGYRDTKPDGSEPTRVDPPTPGSLPPVGQPVSPTSRVWCGGLGWTRPTYPVKNGGPPPRQKKRQPWRRDTEKTRTHPPLSVLNSLQHLFCQRHRHPIGTHLSNVDMVWIAAIKETLHHQPLQDSVLVRKPLHALGHPTRRLDTSLEKEVDQVKVATGVVVPVFPAFHTESNSSW